MTSRHAHDELLQNLDLEAAGTDEFMAPAAGTKGPLFGGLLLAQALMAAGRTTTEARCHSLHSYFLRPGRGEEAIAFTVERLRDGKSLAQRRVVARQAGEALFTAIAGFVREEQGLAHQEAMPMAPEPEGLPEWEELRALSLGDPAQRRDAPVEVRVCDPDNLDPATPEPPRRRVWMRPHGALPDDPLVHAAMIAFISDRTLLRVAARPHGPIWQLRVAASIDHALWLHQPFRFDDWLLYDCESPAAHGGRALALGKIYARDGRRIATSAQEGLLRF